MKKYLRSILCLLLALCMAMCFAACSNDDEDDEEEEEETTSAAGSYEFYSLSAEGVTVDAEGLETAMGMSADEVFIILNKDGTGTLCFAGEAEEIEWDEEEITDSTGESVSYTLKNDKLTLEIEGMEMTFKKTSKKLTVPEKEEEPEITSTTYGIYAMTAEGVTLTKTDLAAVGTTPANTYLILNQDGTGKLSAVGEESDMGWNNAGIWPTSDPTDVATMTIEGDVVTISQDGFVMIFVKEGSSVTPALPTTSSTPAAGAYSLKSMSDSTATYEGATLDLVVAAMELDSIDDLMYLELSADGTGKLVAMGVEGAILWNETSLWAEGQESDAIPYTYANGELTFSIDEYTYVFKLK